MLVCINIWLKAYNSSTAAIVLLAITPRIFFSVFEKQLSFDLQ